MILACRNEKLGCAAVDSILQKYPKGKVQYMNLDLGSFDSVKRFVEEFKALRLPLDILINNAGIGADPEAIGELEKHFMVNHMGHFLLTELLIPDLEKTRGSVVNVSSVGHSMFMKDLTESEKLRDYAFFNTTVDRKGPAAYGFSKLCNIWHCFYLHHKYHDKGIKFNALHPGFVYTNIYQSVPALIRPVVNGLLYMFSKTAEQGSQTTLHVACNVQTSGNYYADNKIVETAKQARDLKRQEELYNLSYDLVRKYLE